MPEFISGRLTQDANLKGYYQMEGNSNSKLQGPNGIDSNMTYSASGKYNQAASFNGSNSQIDLGTTISLNNTSFSLVAWVKRGATGSDYTIFACGDTNATRQKMQLAFTSANVLLFQFFNDDISAAGPYVDTASFHQIVATFNSSTLVKNIYYDGVLVAGPTVGGGVLNVSGKNIYLGQLSSSNWFNGLIDDAVIFNRDLTATEILQLYQSSPLVAGII